MHSQQGGPRFFLAYILPALILLFSDTELTRHPQQVPTELSITGDSVHLWDASYPTRQRKSGPKSGHTVPRETAPYRHRVPSAHCMEPETEITTEYGGEGCFPWSWRVAETGIESADLEQLFPVKPQDNVPASGFGLSCHEASSTRRGILKRSLRRACTRASETGYVWYKGQHIPYEAFPAQLRTRCDWQKRQSRASHKSKRHTTPRQTPLHRFNILQVNVGGLSKMRLQEIQHWALQKEADIVILTETRWSFSTDWSTDSWHCIHSGTQQDKSDGILIMIRPQACSPTQLGIAEFSPAGSC